MTSTQARPSRFGRAALWLLFLVVLSAGRAFPQAVTATLGVGSSPAAVAVNPATGTIYVVNSAGNSVSVINGTTNAVTATVSTGTNPVALAVNPLTNMVYVVNNGSNNVTVINGANNTATTVTDPSAIAPVAVALDPLTNMVYVANSGSNNLTVINGAGNTVAATVGVGTDPAAVAVNPATNMAFVANRASSNVSVVNGANNTVAATVAVGTNPIALTVNAATNMLYVANNGSNNLSVIAGASDTVVATVGTGTNPVAAAVNTVTDTVYVANNGSSNVTVINGSNNTVTATVNAGNGPIAVAADSTTNQVYVANNTSNNVTVIAGATNATTTVADPNATALVAVAVDPVTDTVYVANGGTSNVSVINADSNTVTTTLTTGTNPVAVALNTVTKRVYVVNTTNGTVTVIDGTTNTIVTTVTVGTNPVAIAVNPATNMVYVANSGNNTLSVIDGTNNSVAATINTGTNPVAVAVNPVTNTVYVANNGSGNVTVIDGDNNSVTTTVSAGTTPVAVAVNPATGQVYVANNGSDNITVFDPVVSTNLTITDLAASRPIALAVNSLTNRIYVANSYSDNVTVINGATAAVVATINVGDTPTALALNPITNRIYATNTGNNTVSVIDGNVNAVIATVTAGTAPSAVSVNPTSNRIYVANNGNGSTDFGSVTVIDGTSNTTVTVTDPTANKPYALASNPLTDELYVANNLSSNTSVITAEQIQTNPISVAITPLSGNETSSETPTFDFTATNGFSTAPVDSLLFQMDTWQGSWTPATPTIPGSFTGTTATLLPGFHTLFAYATEGDEATSTTTGSASSPLLGTISSYGFLVATPIADVAPPSLSFGNQQVGMPSPPQTVTVGNPGSATLTFSYALAPGAFSEGAGDTCISAGGQLAPNTSCTIFVVFNPSASGSAASTLTVTDNSNSISGSQQIVSLTGTGITSSFSLNVAVGGSGSGSVTSNPAGIICPTTCAANYATGTQVTLSATPNAGSTFIGWSGACAGVGTCTVTMNSNQAVTATFKLIAATACTGTTTNWIGGASGNWNNPAHWSTGVVPNGSSTNVCINDGNAIPSQVTLDITATVGALTIDTGSSLTISDNTSLVVAGNIANAGQILLNEGGHNTVLTIAGAVNLTGGGTVTLNTAAAGGTAIINQSGNQTLTNVNNTIQGTGNIGSNGLTVVNQAGGIINANVPSASFTLSMSGGTFTNQGLLEATAGGTLQLVNTYNNAGGRILSTGGGSSVQLISATIQGGTLTSANSGALGLPFGTTVTLDGSSQGTLTIVGTYAVADNSTTILKGTINNTGTIQLNEGGHNTVLTMAAPVSLTGNGTVTLNTAVAGGTAIINQSGGQTLTNVNNTIQGTGNIGSNGLTVVNQASGIINANVLSASFTLSMSGGVFANQGLLEATAGGTLQLANTYNNAGGRILASGSGSSVQLITATIQGGTLTSANSGALGLPSGTTATLDGSSQGTLTIAGTFAVADNSTTTLLGTINNTGTIQLNEAGHNTVLTIAGPVSLTGAGAVVLNTPPSGGTAIINESGNQTLTNVNNSIQGAGDIGSNGLSVLNQGTINANSPSQGALVINPNAFTNEGLLEATAGATLQLNGHTFNNTGGMILASGTGSTMQFANGVVIQSGTLSTTGGGSLGAASGNSLTLDGSTHGRLTISGTYTGPDNSTTFLLGTINNTGTIQLIEGGHNALLTLAAPVSLIGNGTVTLNSSVAGGTAIINQTGAQTLTNVDNTLQGTGVIGSDGLSLVNQGTINANVAGSGSLTLNPLGFLNQGMLEASAGGTLVLSGSTITNGAGTIQVNGATSTVQFVTGATIQGGTLSSANGGTLTIPGGNTITFDGSTSQGSLTIVGTYVVADNSTTLLKGTINNTGTIQLNEGGHNTVLTLAAPVSLTGGGTVTLNTATAGGTAIINQSGNQTLTNVNNTLQGTGNIGSNGLSVINQVGGIINANVLNPNFSLVLNPSGFTNQGLLEATAGGTLALSSSTINNNAGTISVNGPGSTVQFVSGATIQGGTLSSVNNGVLTIPSGNSITLDGSTQGMLTIAGTYVLADNSTTFLKGTINNTGTIQLNEGGHNTVLTMAAAVSLTGNGTVTLNTAVPGGTAIINQTGTQTLTNVNNILQGTGDIGSNGLSLINQGTINANVSGSGSLLLNPGGFTNQGMLEATAGGTLALSSTTIFNGTGTIMVNGASSAVQFVSGAVIQGGTLASSNGGTLTIPSGNTITLDGSTTQGTLNITGAYVVADNSTTLLKGTINNTGAIQLNEAGHNALLTIAAPVTLTGGGTVTLNTPQAGGTAIINQSGNQTLTNVNNTLQGTGNIGSNGLSVTNQGTINANVASSGSLTLNPGGFLNQGMLEATAGGTLVLSSSTINNSSGTIQVNGSTSSVQFVNGAVIQAGTLATLNNGVLTIPSGNTITLDGSTLGTLNLAGSYVVADNSTTFLKGTINNAGAIQLNEAGHNTLLTMAAPVSLTGNGTVTLNTPQAGGTAIINQSGSQTLTNVSNTLQGAGVIGSNGLSVINQGTVNANLPAEGALTLNPGVFSNQGLLEASGGATLQVSTAVNNAGGSIVANGSGTAIQFANGIAIQGGTLNTVGGGFLGSVSGNTLTLDGTANAVSITAGGTYTVGNNSTTNILGTINNNGTMLLDSTGNTTALSAPSGATLTGGGMVMMTSSANIITGPSLLNAGNTILDLAAFNITSYTQSAGLFQVAATGLASTTSFSLNGGIAQIDGNLAASGSLSAAGAGTFSGAGTITGNVNMSGVTEAGDIPNPGILTINGNGAGNYTQGSAGAYDVLLGGLTAGSQYSQLNMTGTASLGGTLNVTLINSFVPVAGNQFTILAAGSLNGQFTTTNLPSLSSGLNWIVSYTSTSVVLSVASSASFTLTVTTLGTGNGTVTDNLAELNCTDTAGVQTGTCSASYIAGTTVNLTASPVSPTTFGGWEGACTGTAGCSVIMNSAQSVTAAFVPVPVTIPVTFSCPGGVYPCSNVTPPPAVFNCPSGSNPCTDPNAHSLALTATQVNTAFTMTVAANEVSSFQADGDCQSGQNPSSDFDCRFTSFFPFETLVNGDIIVPICDAYSNGNCVFYSVYFGTRGIEPPPTDYAGPISWSIAWNNISFLPPPTYPYQTNNPRLYDDPDYEVSTTTPYGTNCGVPMLINGNPTDPAIYCQFVFDITTYYNPIQPPDAGIGGKTKQFNDVVVAFPLTIAAPNLSVTKTPDQAVVNLGSPIGYTVTMSNSSAAGTGTATNAVLNDPLPAGSAVNWTISPAYSGIGTCTITGSAPAQTLTCALGSMSPAISASVHVSSASSSAGTYLNTATLSADNNPPVTASATIQVLQATPTLTWPTPAPITYGTPLSGTQLDATASVPGAFVYTPPAGTILGAGLQTLSVLFTPTDINDYTTATDSVSLQVNQAGSTTSIVSSIPNPSNVGQTVVISFQVTGTGVPTGSVTVSATTGESCSGALAAGAGSCSIVFTTAGTRTLTASYTGDSNFNGSSSQGVTQVVNASGPIATLSPSGVSFGGVHLGRFARRLVTLTNTGTAPMTVSSIKISPPGKDTEDFLAISSCPSTLGVGKGCMIAVTFFADKDNHRLSARLAVSDNAPGSPQLVPLSATVINPKASLNPTVLNFGDQKVGTTSPAKKVTLINTGISPLVLSGVAVSGDFALASGTTCSKGTSLAPASSCVMNVTFTPTAIGMQYGRLTIRDNALPRTQEVALSGTGD